MTSGLHITPLNLEAQIACPVAAIKVRTAQRAVPTPNEGSIRMRPTHYKSMNPSTFAFAIRTAATKLALFMSASLRVLAAEPADFQNPPASARATGYGWWFNGHMNKAGITRDLEEFKAKGLGGVMMVCSSSGGYGGNPVPEGSATSLSPEWGQV